MRYLLMVAGCGVLLVALAPFSMAVAQENNLFNASIARTYDIAGGPVESGDIIAYEESTNRYRLAHTGDTSLVGVVVRDPLIVLETAADGTAVVASGEARINVSAIGGPIAVGDAIAPSRIPGKGKKAQPGDIVVAVARTSFSESQAQASVEVGGREVAVGQITAVLGVSPLAAPSEDTVKERGVPPPPGGLLSELFRYLLAFVVSVGSLYISFRNFGANVKNGIISIGRNPLAKTSIQAMVILNIILIVLIGGGGLFLGLAILLLPI